MQPESTQASSFLNYLLISLFPRTIRTERRKLRCHSLCGVIDLCAEPSYSCSYGRQSRFPGIALTHLLLFVCGGWSRGGQRIDHLARAGIAKLLARLFLYGLGIGFQGFDLLLAACIILLQRLDLAIKLLRFRSLLVKGEESISAKDCMVTQQA